MSALWELWRQWSGVAMAERTAYTKGYDAGFRAALNAMASVRGAAFVDGFVEGRESVRTIPLDSSFADEEFGDEEEASWPPTPSR